MSLTSQLAEFVAGPAGEQQQSGFAIAPGIVTNPIDLTGEGRVQVRVPTLPSFEPWARLAGVGGGPGRGFYWAPQKDDEVLVAFNQNDERDAYCLCGLWSTLDRPPTDLPTDAVNKRLIKTGIAGAPGHEVEFDDLLQSIKITSSTQQEVEIDPQKIKLSTTGGTLSLTMDVATQTISIESTLNLNLKAVGKVSIEGAQVEIKGLNVNMQATGPCQVQGLPVKIN
ncbi:MAG: phage baseplate assembly protein V [Planctomycetota bacterium]